VAGGETLREDASLSMTSMPPLRAMAMTQFWLPKSRPHGNPIVRASVVRYPVQPRRRSSKESIRGTGAVVQALPATGIGVLRRPKAYWPKKTTYALVDTHESKLR